jgi:hypothetical protein
MSDIEKIKLDIAHIIGEYKEEESWHYKTAEKIIEYLLSLEILKEE